VVPATEGTPVLVLAGSLRGKRGRLLKRNTGGLHGRLEGAGGVEAESGYDGQAVDLVEVA